MPNRYEFSPCGFISIDHQGLIVDVNETFLTWTGFTKKIVGQHFEEILSSANKMIFHSHFYPSISIYGIVEELYITFKHATGEAMPYLLNAKKFGEGENERIDCVFMQMKKRIDYEMELRAAKEQLQDAYSAKKIAFEQLEQIYAVIEKKQQELIDINLGLVKVTNTDKLTGLANRKLLQETLSELMEQYNREQNVFSIIILDIDFFKRVNDTYGHPVGDQVLIQLSKILETHVREQDLPCRYGGEEFIVVLPNTTEHDARVAAERIHEAVYSTIWDEVSTLTISAGVYTVNQDDTEQTVINKADKALYFSKQNGRNQVNHYNEITQEMNHNTK